MKKLSRALGQQLRLHLVTRSPQKASFTIYHTSDYGDDCYGSVMTNKLVFLDTNVLMELLFGRPNHELVAAAILDLPNEAKVCASILSTSTLLYFVESEKFDKTIAHNFIHGFSILDMTLEDYVWAENNDQGDFEDALQTACARRHGCSSILTLDKRFNGMYGKFLSVHTISIKAA